jgi:hypothetical protein
VTTEILSLWRSPLDQVGLSEAQTLASRQPRCSIGYGEDFSAMTIYNFGHYVMGGASPSMALTNMFLAMGAANPIGGRAFVPQKTFSVVAPTGGFTVPDQCDMDGSGGGGSLPPAAGGTAFYHFVITPQATGTSKFLNCVDNMISGHTSGGVYFRSLAFEWGASTEATDTCIYAAVWNTRAINCTFTNCPLAFNGQDLACTLEQCTISYNVATPNSTRAVILSGQENAVLGPSQFAQTSIATGGATGCTCISIESAEHPVVSGIQIYEWTIGIDFANEQETRFAQITNCDIQCWETALNIGVPAFAANITTSIKCTGCLLAKTSDSTDSTGKPIVKISSNGFPNTMLNDVALIDCTVFNMQAIAAPNQHGLQIISGSNIKVIGGTYSNNSISAGAGIAITGSPTDVQIIGVNLQPSYPGSPNVRSQQYGLLISGTPDAVLVSGCDMTGYTVMGSAPVVVTGFPQTGLLIFDCPGYNDQNTPLSATTTDLTTGVSAATSSTPYFGPSVIIYSGVSSMTLTVFGQTIPSSFGIVYLPSPYDTFSFSTAPTSFTWIGK